MKQFTDRIHNVVDRLEYEHEYEVVNYEFHVHYGLNISHWFNQNQEEFINKWGTPVPVEGVPTWVYEDQECFANLIKRNHSESSWLIHTDQSKWVKIVVSCGNVINIDVGNVQECGEMTQLEEATWE